MGKKKKDKDFQKVKLKVGRKLPKGTNDTKTDFKSKKIIIKEARSIAKDPIHALVSSTSASAQVKIICLQKVWESVAINYRIVNGELMTCLSKYLMDYEHKVRNEAIKVIKGCINALESKKESISPLVALLLTYLNCGLTHINHLIVKDALKMFEFIMPKCDETQFDQLMQIMTARIKNKAITATDYELCSKLVEMIHSRDKVLQNSYKPMELTWSKDNCHLDVSSIYLKPSIEFNISFQSTSSTVIIQ